ncbi:hypothetical protein SLEP1_g11164 [Rubroshorea leprosula]|uniref:DDE Tnp4 domain-containing protein n=1 Tax=Rubroshorea leprosula TaxID=152421 RepID=A0AAV5IAG6_9ROSI|nr:hypothetical protein SLEP1_g11164 [Rubroshorea leprosula]
MVYGDNGLSVQHKRPREKIKENEQEDMEFCLLLMKFFLILVVICYCHKHRYRGLQLCDQDERTYQSKIWIRLLDNEKVCLHQLHVTKQAFKKLCDAFVEKGGLVATRYVTIKEIVALFLHIPIHDLKNNDKWKWFEGALGALDGTLIEITIPASEQGKYQDRKGNLSTNVLGACDANLKFTYVLADWEGLTSDSHVLHDALTRCNSLKVPQNKYY